MIKKILKGMIVFMLSFTIVLLLVTTLQGKDVTRVEYVKFLEMVENKEVSAIQIDYDSAEFEFVDKEGNYLRTDNPKKEDFKEFLLLNEVKVVEREDTTFWDVISPFLTILLILATFLLPSILIRGLVREVKGTLQSRGGSIVPENKTMIKTEQSTITFDDLQGCNEVKKDMQFVVDFLKNPKKYHEMGARMPKGIVLYGPPGTGKTLTAKAIAGTAGVPFFSVSGSDFMEMYVGVGAKRVRGLYKKAKENAPCIVFIDEIDAVGKKRTSDSNGEKDQTINALLTELDGFSGKEGVITICATNRLELLDDTLIRPGRFDKHVAVPLPEKEDRIEILKLHAKNKKLSSEVDLENIANMTVGFSGADLEALLNESAFIAVNENKDFITLDDIDRAFYRLVMKGDRKENLTNRDKEELELVAWHEAGHALATKLLTDDEVPKVTIIPSTSGAGGVTFRAPKKSGLHSKKYLEQLIKIKYAGRVAEYLLLGNEEDITTGASNDIKQASNLIKDYITTYGMSDEYGMFNVSVLDGYITANQDKLAEEGSRIAKKMYEDTLKILTDNKHLLNKIATRLIERESLSNEELDEIINPQFVPEEILEVNVNLNKEEATA